MTSSSLYSWQDVKKNVEETKRNIIRKKRVTELIQVEFGALE